MQNNQIEELKPVLMEQVRYLEKAVEPLILNRTPLASMVTSVWLNPSPSALNGALYIKPNNIENEQPVDVICCVRFEQEHFARLLVYLEWADGEAIADIADESISYSSTSDLASKLDKAISLPSKKVMDELSRLLALDLPPRYGDW